MKSILLVAICVMLPVLCSAAPDVSRVLEAENFQPGPGSHWRPISYGQNYFVDAIGNGYISGEKLLSAPEHCPASTASLTTNIQKAGKYRVWVHFEAPKDHNVCFGLRLEQGLKTALDVPMGGADQLKLWPLNWGYHKQINPSYGGGDNVAWQGATVDLEAGPARFTLYTRDNPEPAAARNIDVVYLTPDTSGTPKNAMDPFLDELPRPGRLWMRIRNTGSAPVQPSLGSFHINRRDWSMRDTGIDPGFGPIGPGETSEWKDIGRAIDTIHGTTLELNAPSASFSAVVELAHSPGDTRVWRRDWTPAERPLHIWVPVNLDFRWTRTSTGILATVEGYLKDLPPGNTPKQIRFAAALPGPQPGRSGWINLFYRLGYASPMTSPDHDEAEFLALLNEDTSRRAIAVTHTDPGIDPARLQEELSDPGHAAMRRFVDVFSIGDEINLNAYRGEPETSFPDWLKAKGLTLEEIGVSSWDQARPARADENPILYVEGRDYAQHNAIKRMSALTSAITSAFNGDVHVAANYAPHPYFLPDIWQWVDVFKDGALTMPWSEDYAWQVPIASPQIIGFSLDVMRAAAKYHDLPMTYYCMPHSPGNTSDDFRRSNYLALGRGVKIVNHFSLGPQMFATENYVDWRDGDRWREIYRIIHETGKVDGLLAASRPVPAEVAVLLPRYSDLWEKAADADANVYGVERQSLWLALKHLQVPVDLLTGEDIAEGALQRYKVLYVAGPNILRQAAEEIARWVGKGGALFASAGGGLSDQYNRPLATLLDVYGLQSHLLNQNPAERVVRPKMELPGMRPMDELSFSGETPFKMPALAATDSLQPLATARVLATFSNGKPAALANHYGRGTAYLIGAMPGLAYLKPAIPDRPFDRNSFAHFLPVHFDSNVRILIERPLRDAGVQPEVWCSDALVEGDLLTCDQASVVSLVNFTARPIKNLTVKVRAPGKPARVWTARLGDLPFSYSDHEVNVSLRLDVTDFLVLQ